MIFHRHWPISMLLHFFHWSLWKKWNTMLIGQSGPIGSLLHTDTQWKKSEIIRWLVRAEHVNCCDRIIEMTRTGFRKLYFFSYSLQRTLAWLQEQQKMILMEKNQPLLSWEVSQPPPYAQKSQHAPVVSHQEQQEATSWKRVWKSDILT